MNIPFLGEKDIILNDIHITNKHPGERKMRKLFVDSGYIQEGYTYDIKKIIKECHISNNSYVHKILQYDNGTCLRIVNYLYIQQMKVENQFFLELGNLKQWMCRSYP